MIMTTSIMVGAFIKNVDKIFDEQGQKGNKKDLRNRIEEAFEDFNKNVGECGYKEDYANKLIVEGKEYKESVLASLDYIMK